MRSLLKPDTGAVSADTADVASTDTTAPAAGGAADGARVVEAASAEEAIAEVHRRFGDDAQIVDAQRVLRGGIGGFFAKEHVQLHVGDVLADPAPAASDEDVAARAAALARELTSASPVDRLIGDGSDEAAGDAGGGARTGTGGADELDGAHDTAVDFATYLQTHLAGGSTAQGMPPSASGGARPVQWPEIHPGVEQHPVVTTAATVAEPTPVLGATPPAQPMTDLPPTPPAPPAPTAPAPPAPPAPALPASVAPACPVPTALEGDRDPDAVPWGSTRLLHLGVPASIVHGLAVERDDDLAWTSALAQSVVSLCRPLPSGEYVLVGPQAPELAGELDAPVARSRAWRTALGQHRWRHLVIGGDGWRHELTDEPLAVSWTRPEDLPDALRCATELGLVLGFGPLGGRIRRARPLDVALAIRDLVEER